MNERAKVILNFWFVQSTIKDWFTKNSKYDQKIKILFFKDLQKAINNEYDTWQDTPEECLALVILLDQFSRNLFRNSEKAFSQDCKTRLIVNEAIDKGYLEKLEQQKIHFLLLPLIHSEDINDHIFAHNLVDTYLKSYEFYERLKKSWNDHTIAIKKFGRYPHRNIILKRKSTINEEEFLKLPNSSW
tara:strand:+ start:139 stop:699 length:561 start_codon:yes stop_codon:yes gene_type:complete